MIVMTKFGWSSDSPAPYLIVILEIISQNGNLSDSSIVTNVTFPFMEKLMSHLAQRNELDIPIFGVNTYNGNIAMMTKMDTLKLDMLNLELPLSSIPRKLLKLEILYNAMLLCH